MLRIGEWQVDPASGEISRSGEACRLEIRAMRLLLCLAKHAGEVVSIDDLLDQVWSGVNVTPDSVYQAVASLRRLLGDDPRQPTYIETLPRLGYRMVAAVRPLTEDPEPTSNQPPSRVEQVSHTNNGRRLRASVFWASGLAAGLALAAVVAFRPWFHAKIANAGPSSGLAVKVPSKSIAVLPFLDLTEGMREEEFADGMTEELIDRLSKIPGLQVAAPTSSFYFKGKQIPVSDIAKDLGVAYVLDGSVRKSGSRLRVAARLIHPCNGYVVWSETYDRRSDDILQVQDDIAGKVTTTLGRSITASPERNPPH